PEAAASGAGRRHVEGLVELDFAILVLHGDHGVAEIDEVVPLHLPQLETHLFGLVRIVVTDCDQRAHKVLLFSAIPCARGRLIPRVVYAVNPLIAVKTGLWAQIPIGADPAAPARPTCGQSSSPLPADKARGTTRAARNR